ncbi:MAG: low specificity L-threonine aldolase [Rhizobiaceae bacterium]|nr:low specificity L-threonine aldolase [Rhizobiaceae bacterium]
MTHDLRSDFLGPPTDEMVEATARAAASPDGFALRESRYQRELESYAAELLGKEDALLFPTCTMANLAAVMAQVAPGETVIADAESHCVLSEAGGIAAVAGAMVRGLAGRAGLLPVDELSAALGAAPDAQRQPATLAMLETTHNRSGGMPLPLAHLEQVGELARASGAGLHIDGARFFNAAIALGISPAAMAAPATTVSLSLNKGLCAPNGALLVGSRAVIERALTIRQRLGGGMRPAGPVAAAGLVALRTMLPQLQRDHDNARELVAALRRLDFRAGPQLAGTNIVLVETGLDAPAQQRFLVALADAGVLAIPFGAGRLRLCLHRGIDAAAIPEIANAFASARNALAHPET